MGMFVSVMTALRIRPFIEKIPTAASVPNTVAMKLDSSAITTELPSSLRSV